MKLFRANFPEIVVVAETQEEAKEYIYDEFSNVEFNKDIFVEDNNLTEITNKQQVPENWDLDAIPWGLDNQATIEEWMKLSKVFNQLDNEGTRILTQLLKYGSTG
jgi:hypothetical protein